MSGSLTGEVFGFGQGALIQEFGYDDDVDFDIREAIETFTGEELEDEDYRGVADGVIAWWRSDDGGEEDLADYLVDCSSALDENANLVWLFVPEQRNRHHVPATEINEAAQTAGLSVTRSHGVNSGWTAYRLTAPKSR